MKIVTSSLLLASAVLVGCQFEDSQQTGTLSLAITDGAVTNATNVFITVSGITVKGEDGQETFEFTNDDNEPEARQFDLLTLMGDASASLVDDWTLPAGHYDWVRLHVETDDDLDTYVVLDGSEIHELTIPSGELKLVSGFNIPANGSADFTLDIDLNKGLVESNGNYKLKPVMRLLDNSTAGHIAGSVDGNIYLDASCTDIAVYAFPGTDTPADDIFNDEGPELVAFAAFDDVAYQYELGFLSAGPYTLHLACDPVDDPETDDTLNFISGQSQNVTVEADATQTVDFTL